MSDEAAKKVHEERGHTISVFLPPEADWEQAVRFFNRVHVLAHEGFFPNREDWRPLVEVQGGDVLNLDTHEHVYLSTGCFHGDHEYCQSNTGLCGQKTPGACKFCAAQCICDCHAERESDIVDG